MQSSPLKQVLWVPQAALEEQEQQVLLALSKKKTNNNFKCMEGRVGVPLSLVHKLLRSRAPYKEKPWEEPEIMMPLESNLAGKEMDYATLSDTLERHRFTLGGNWDYQQGCFDRCLDGEKQTVWLRIPFEVPKGVFDPETAKQVTRVKIGTPFVLRHLYDNGEDANPHFNTAAALVNQFQSPENVDAPVDESYLEKAAMIVKEVEEAFAV